MDTFQGLGGHMSGHKRRQNLQAAAAGLHSGKVIPKKRGARPEVSPRELPSALALILDGQRNRNIKTSNVRDIGMRKG